MKGKIMFENIGKVKSKIKRKINQYTLDGDFIKTWDSMSQVAKMCGSSRALITLACQKKIKTAKGYQWRYEDEARHT